MFERRSTKDWSLSLATIPENLSCEVDNSLKYTTKLSEATAYRMNHGNDPGRRSLERTFAFVRGTPTGEAFVRHTQQQQQQQQLSPLFRARTWPTILEMEIKEDIHCHRPRVFAAVPSRLSLSLGKSTRVKIPFTKENGKHSSTEPIWLETKTRKIATKAEMKKERTRKIQALRFAS